VAENVSSVDVQVEEGKLIKKIRIYFLAVKYWLQGDTWDDAVEYAMVIVKGFKK